MNDQHKAGGWRKSTYSSTQTNCVEIGRIGRGAAVRDTKDRGAGGLTISSARWSDFVLAIKSGSCDR